MQTNKRKILAAVEDLFFMVRISDAAMKSGFEVEFSKSEKDVIDKAKAEVPPMVIVGFNNNNAKPVSLISKLKSDAATKGISVIGFVSHVSGELKQRAQDAGANMAMARSAFSTNRPTILKRHTGAVN